MSWSLVQALMAIWHRGHTATLWPFLLSRRDMIFQFHCRFLASDLISPLLLLLLLLLFITVITMHLRSFYFVHLCSSNGRCCCCCARYCYYLLLLLSVLVYSAFFSTDTLDCVWFGISGRWRTILACFYRIDAFLVSQANNVKAVIVAMLQTFGSVRLLYGQWTKYCAYAW